MVHTTLADLKCLGWIKCLVISLQCRQRIDIRPHFVIIVPKPLLSTTMNVSETWLLCVVPNTYYCRKKCEIICCSSWRGINIGMCKYQQKFLVHSSNIITFKDLTHKGFTQKLDCHLRKVSPSLQCWRGKELNYVHHFLCTRNLLWDEIKIGVDLSVGGLTMIQVYLDLCMNFGQFLLSTWHISYHKITQLWWLVNVEYKRSKLWLSVLDKWFVQMHLNVKCLVRAFPFAM